MIKLIALGSSVFCALCAAGQSTFEKYYEAFGAKLNLNELSNAHILTGIAWEGGTSLLDSQGNMLHSRSYQVGPMALLQSVKRVSDNAYYFGTFYAPGPPNAYPLLGRMDSLGNISNLRSYHLDALAGPEHGIGDLEVISHKSVVGWDRDNRLFLMKADSELTHVWSRAFAQEGVFHFVKELPSGDLLAGFDLAGGGAGLMRMDADGNTLWCKSYFHPDGLMHDAVIENDSAFVTIGFEGPVGQRKVFMMKVNGSGDVLWSRGYNTTSSWSPSTFWPMRMVKAQDGNYVFLTTRGSMLGTGRPWLLKTDTNGDTLWVRRYGVNGTGYESADLLATADGGFMFSGGSYPWGAYIFKTDSLGHIPCSEDPPPPLYITALFPVDSNITLTSVNGAVTFPAYAQDTTYAPITVTDGCTVTHVPVEHQVTKPSIRPNPTPGIFTMQFADPLVAESYYSVYDTMGRLLHQRPWPKGMASEEIDLGRFGSGTYVLKLTTPEGVCTERVVVSP